PAGRGGSRRDQAGARSRAGCGVRATRRAAGHDVFVLRALRRRHGWSMAAARVLRRFVRLVRSRPAVLAALLLALAWPIPPAAQDEDTLLKAPAGSYRGRVVDAQTGQPIPDAVVVILWQRLDDQIEGVRRLVTAQETLTDSKGEFVHDVHAVEAKVPPRTLAPRLMFFRPGYSPVPDRPQVHPPGVSAARFSVPDATATMTAVSDPEDRSEAFNT